MPPTHLVIDRTWDGQRIAPADEIKVSFHVAGESLIVTLDAPFYGDTPPGTPAGSCWELWNHEVVELFIATKGDAYLEMEWGPHGHYLVLQLAGERNIASHGHTIEFTASISEERWSGMAKVPLTLVPPRPWRVNAYAIHGEKDTRRYLASEPVPGPEPDYHQLRFFRWV